MALWFVLLACEGFFYYYYIYFFYFWEEKYVLLTFGLKFLNCPVFLYQLDNLLLHNIWFCIKMLWPSLVPLGVCSGFASNLQVAVVFILEQFDVQLNNGVSITFECRVLDPLYGQQFPISWKTILSCHHQPHNSCLQ